MIQSPEMKPMERPSAAVMGRWSNLATPHISQTVHYVHDVHHVHHVHQVPTPFLQPNQAQSSLIKPNHRLAECLNNGISMGYAGVPPDWAAGRAETACH